jgi:hypothetical protein
MIKTKWRNRGSQSSREEYRKERWFRMNLNFGDSRSCYDRNNWFSFMKEKKEIIFSDTKPKFKCLYELLEVLLNEEFCVNYFEKLR